MQRTLPSVIVCAVPEFIWEISAKIGSDVMHAVIRTYSGKGAKELFDVLEKSKVDVEKLLRAIKGFVSLSLVRTANGGVSLSVFQDKAGTDESIRVARDWVSKNASSTGVAAPTISEGTVILHLK
jgi:hypothetical protein